MSRSSASEWNRGQVQPLPALIAVLALILALTAYADVTQSLPPTEDATPAEPALKRIEANATTGAVLDPTALSPTAAGLDGYLVNVTLRTAQQRVTTGPTPPTESTRTIEVSDAASTVAVGRGGRVVPGVLEVEVWPWTEE